MNRISKSKLSQEKYLVTHNGYFRLATKVLLGMGTTDAKLHFCHGISEKSKDKTF